MKMYVEKIYEFTEIYVKKLTIRILKNLWKGMLQNPMKGIVEKHKKIYVKKPRKIDFPRFSLHAFM